MNKPDPRGPEMAALYVTGLTCAQVGRRFGVTDETVRRYVRAAGVAIRTRWNSVPSIAGPAPAAQPAAAETEPVDVHLGHKGHVSAVTAALGGRGFPFYEMKRAA